MQMLVVFMTPFYCLFSLDVVVVVFVVFVVFKLLAYHELVDDAFRLLFLQMMMLMLLLLFFIFLLVRLLVCFSSPWRGREREEDWV
jgi:hypothetical protein